MKILLIEDVEKLGWLGDVVDVAEGYARNYLIPQGVGAVPTEASLRGIAAEKAKRAEKRIEQRSRLEKACKAVEGAEAVIAAKANELGHLFGSVTISQIAQNLREQGFEVADEVVKLDGHIKEVGNSQVTIRFAEDLTATVNVVVVAQQEEEKSEEAKN